MPSDPAARRSLDDIDLIAIADALGDASGQFEWWYDPATGNTELGMSDWGGGDEDDEFDPAERGLVRIERFGSRDAYREMVVFADSVADANASTRLTRSLEGRGAFRRFRDTLRDFPELADHWYTFTAVAGQRRAVAWLVDEGLVDDGEAEAKRAAQAATMNEVLAAIGEGTAIEIDEAGLRDRWDEVCSTIEAGRSVNVLRDGQLWAVISPRTD